MRRPRFTGLWRNPDFVKLWSANTVSVFGALMGALQFTAILVLDATALQMSLLAAAGVAPGLLLGLFAGVWVDRVKRRPLLIAADLGRAAFLASIPIAYVLGILRIEQLYIVAFAEGALTVLFEIAYPSYLPSLVKRDELVEANSKISASASIVEVSAFSFGGWIVQLFSALASVAINAVTFAVSALFLVFIRAKEPLPANSASRRNMAREAAEGLQLVWREPALRAIAVSVVAMGVGSGIIAALITLYGIRELGIQPGFLGMIYAIGGVTSFIGAVLATRVTRRIGIGPAMTAGMLLAGAGTLFIPLAQPPLLFAVACYVATQLVTDGGWTIYNINQVTLRQTITPAGWLGRVNSSTKFAGKSAFLGGSLLAGVLAETAGLRVALLVGALSIVAGGLWLLASPTLRHIKEPPTATPGIKELSSRAE